MLSLVSLVAMQPPRNIASDEPQGQGFRNVHLKTCLLSYTPISQKWIGG